LRNTVSTPYIHTDNTLYDGLDIKNTAKNFLISTESVIKTYGDVIQSTLDVLNAMKKHVMGMNEVSTEYLQQLGVQIKEEIKSTNKEEDEDNEDDEDDETGFQIQQAPPEDDNDPGLPPEKYRTKPPN